MSDSKLFRLRQDGTAVEIPGRSSTVEKSLQVLMERNLSALLGIEFLASEHSTGKTHRGRIDTLGIDENNCPVIIEYKRATNENVINQGLYYLDWLLDHKEAFKLLVMESGRGDVADDIEWSSPRLLCIAGGFTKYDQHAVQQINRNIELIRYRYYGDSLILLELVNAVTESSEHESSNGERRPRPGRPPITEKLSQAGRQVRDLYEELESFVMALGDDVQMKTLKHYIAFKRLRNFVCVLALPQEGALRLYANLDPDDVKLEPGFTQDKRHVGHLGTGDLEIIIRSPQDLERAKPLIEKSYGLN